MALTLIEAAKLAPDADAVYIEEFAASSDILRVIPFQDVQGGALPYNREEELPGIGFRGVNEAYDESTGIINPQVEVCKIAGGDLDVDRFIVDTQGPGSRSAHELMKVKSLAQGWTRTFLKGDSSTNPRVFDGLQVRLTGSQLINNNAAGGPLSLNKLDELIDAVRNPTHLVMSRSTRRRLTAAGRNTGIGGHINFTQDEFGRRVDTYCDLPVLIADTNYEDILSFTESSADGTNVQCGSIYCVSFDEMAVTGIQGAHAGQFGISVRDLGEMETKPVFRTRIDWYCAIAVLSGRSAARLRGITNAPVTV
ncbi:hypothetical protein H6F43_17035 [Leptolyngbya sp. FACHB-36]|uniref:major capsid protein n=1 Tax=Leptolyngbya sp. FACHB-36 TaxID=2692808 RepID=UPI001680D785|nr:hypothetical protein [Leptolyngbya sp. FACHB-36]MBD2021888.1 hypothetical protein [Leptolyngbya sp. FACHB-36]